MQGHKAVAQGAGAYKNSHMPRANPFADPSQETLMYRIRFQAFAAGTHRRIATTKLFDAKSIDAALDQAREHFYARHPGALYPTFITGAKSRLGAGSISARVAASAGPEEQQ